MTTRSKPAFCRPFAAACLTAFVLVLAGAWRVAACSTPVFQYALENWPPDVYDLVVAGNGLSEAAVRAQADTVLQRDANGTLNAALRLQQDAALAGGSGRIELRFPHRPAPAAPLWSAPWSTAALRQVADSPVRARLADELLHGASAVFLFLPAGRADADAAARTRLQTILDELARALPPPAPAEDQAPADVPATPRVIRFAILDVPREDPAEAFLRALLLATEPDLAGLHEPMTFPVFGRGRVLYAIVGGGINREVLGETCAFLTGACSCQVKAQNPGVDMLLRADWDQVTGLSAGEATELPPLTLLELPPIESPAPPAPAAAETAASAPASGLPPTPPAPPRFGRRVLWLGVLALGVAVAGSLWLLRRPRSR